MKTVKTGIFRSYFLAAAKLILALILLCGASYAGDGTGMTVKVKLPDADNLQIVSTTDGSVWIGRIVSIRENEVIFKTDLGEITIPTLKISEIREVPSSSIRSGQYWFENPNATRLYFAPTARMLKKGTGYFSDYWLFFPGIAYGFTDNFTFGGGMSLFPGVDPGNQVFYFTPKIGLKTSPNSNIAAGALLIAIPEIDNESPLVGILYGVGTFGDTDGSLTVGLGYGFVDDQLADKPMFMLGGEKRLSRRVSFVSENWIFPGADFPVVSYGFRFFGQGLSVDLALFNALGEEGFFPGLPWIDFVFNFGE